MLRVLVSVHTEQGHALHDAGSQVVQETQS